MLIIGAGRCGTALSHLLEAEFSPYQVVGFLDDDQAKQGKVMGSPKVLGTTDRFKEIASKMRVTTAILAITHDRPSGLVSRILEARLNGMTIMEMPTVYEVPSVFRLGTFMTNGCFLQMDSIWFLKNTCRR